MLINLTWLRVGSTIEFKKMSIIMLLKAKIDGDRRNVEFLFCSRAFSVDN